MGAQRRRWLHSERGRSSIDEREVWTMLRRAGSDELVGLGSVMEVGRSVRSRNLTLGVVSYGPEAAKHDETANHRSALESMGKDGWRRDRASVIEVRASRSVIQHRCSPIWALHADRRAWASCFGSNAFSRLNCVEISASVVRV